MAKDLAIVLNNGSINSAVASAIAAQKHRTVLLYGEISPRPLARSRAAYEQQAAHFKPYREHTVALPYVATLAGNRQSADARNPVQAGHKMLDMLPLLAAAARFASYYKAVAIYVGLRMAGDAKAPTPHATDELARATEFVQIWNEMLEHTCGMPELTIETPLLDLDPWQVVDVGFQTLTPFEKTWSCLEDGAEPCWACPGCRSRDAAFQQAAKPDPLRTAKKRGGS